MIRKASKRALFSLLKFEVRLSKFEFDIYFWVKVREVRSSNMLEFGCSKFDFFEFVPPLIILNYWIHSFAFDFC